MNLEYQRQPHENLKQYKLRLCRNRELYGLSWQVVTDLINKESGENWSESKYRKWFYAYQEGFEDGVNEKINSQDILEEIEEKQRFLQKEKVKFQDQKREYMNLIRQQARFEHLKEEIHKSIQELVKQKPLQLDYLPFSFSSNKKAIALWSDWHFGADFINSLNTYNPDIFRIRVEKLVTKIIQYGKRNEVNELIIGILGDMICGAIHVGTRVQSSEDVIKQIQTVSEVLAEVIVKLASVFPKIKVVTIIGNHARLIPNKTESLLRENLEYLIPWYLESRLSPIPNIEIIKDTDGYHVEEIENEKFVFVHGDLDFVNNTAKVLPQMLGFVPKYVLAGHIHHNHVKEHGKTTVIVNGSMMGIDDYAISKRFYAEPMQKLLILDGSDIECTYDIKLMA